MFTPNPFLYAVAAPPWTPRALHYGQTLAGGNDADIRSFAPVVTSFVQDQLIAAAAGLDAPPGPAPIDPVYTIEHDPFASR